MIVNNHTLPDKLLEFQQLRQIITDQHVIHNLLKKNMTSPLILYEIGTIYRETENLLSIYEVQVLNLDNDAYNFFKQEMSYFGNQTRDIFPGTLDMRKAIVIGDFECDIPICLDYRNSETDPIVVYLNSQLVWEKIADSYNDFIGVLNAPE